jgi:tripartite-type tricarboxylate transporter receptor subunit TctC
VRIAVTDPSPEQATPAALERLLKTEIDRWDRTIRDAGITPP